jgi:hypothetical protein
MLQAVNASIHVANWADVLVAFWNALKTINEIGCVNEEVIAVLTGINRKL